MRQWAVVAVLVACARLLVDAQVGGTPGGIVTVGGQVVADADDRPLAGVYVNVRPLPTGQTAAVLTDPNGHFELSLPAAEQYQFSARKAGFVPITTNNKEIRLEEGAVITGTVIDDAGEPVVQAKVATAEADGTEQRSTRTDDHGEYRLFSPPSEMVVVSVTTQGAETMTPTRGTGAAGTVRIDSPSHVTYYPGTADIMRATPFELMPGEVKSGMDFVIPTAQSIRQPFRGLESIGPMNGFGAGGNAANGTAVVQGRVLDSDNRAVANALVVLANERAASATRLTRTDEEGNFAFRQVPAGSMRVMASKAGFTPDEARPTIAAQQDRPIDLDLRLTAWGSISGRVLNEFGEPIQDAHVQVLRTRYMAGRRTLVPASTLEPETDDRGAYRVYALEPGTYIVTAQMEEANAGDTPGYARAYYPGTANPSGAVSLTIVPGQNTGDIDIQLSSGSTFSVTGRIFNAGGQPTAIPNVQLWPTQQGGTAVSVPLAAGVNPDGTFTFTNVANGDYVVQAYRGRLNSTTEGEFGAVGVTVSGRDVTDLAVVTMAGSTISGTIVLEAQDGTRQPSRASIEISPLPGDLDLAPASNWATAGVGPDWKFSFQGVSGPRRIIPTQLPAGWAVKEVRVNGIDVGDRALPFGNPNQSLTNVEVVLTDRPSQLQGRVIDARGQGASNSYVLLFPPERDHWYPLSRYVRRIATQADGSFTIAGMSPSGYYVVVLGPEAGTDDGWQDPTNLESLITRSSFVMLEQAQRTVVELRRP